jgi:hypothetical protein
LKSYYENIMETKICCRCNLDKELTNFGKNKRSKDGFRYECNDCRILESEKYRKENSEKIINIRKKYYNLNKEKSLNRTKLWVSSNPEKFNETRKKWKLNNKEKYNSYMKTWRSENREFINTYVKTRKLSNPLFKITENCRGRLREILLVSSINKKTKTFDIIGCSPEFLKNHLENQFTDGMSWDNYGYYGWHIDHIIPLSSANTEDEIYKLCHYTNLQPLWAKDNLVKGTKLPHIYNKI